MQEKDLTHQIEELNEIKALIAVELRKKRIRYIAKTDDLNIVELEKNKVTVPVVVSFIFLIIYIMMGSILFRNLENWTYVQSMYFSFIAIATIGKKLKFF